MKISDRSEYKVRKKEKIINIIFATKSQRHKVTPGKSAWLFHRLTLK